MKQFLFSQRENKDTRRRGTESRMILYTDCRTMQVLRSTRCSSVVHQLCTSKEQKESARGLWGEPGILNARECMWQERAYIASK